MIIKDIHFNDSILHLITPSYTLEKVPQIEISRSSKDLIQLRLDGGPGLGDELITAGVQDHVQRYGGRPHSQGTDGRGTTDVLTKGEGKAAVGDTRILG